MAKLKKVVHVMRRFVPDKWGGTESVVFNLSRELIEQGVACKIVCTDMFAQPGLAVKGNVPIRRFRYILPWFGLSEEAKHQLRLKGGSPLSLGLFWGLLREKNLSLIHTHVQHRLGGMARTVAKLRGIPLVVSIHGGLFTVPPDQIEKMTQPFQGKLEWGKVFGFLFGARRVLRDADAIICVGENEYKSVQAQYPVTPVFLVPNGVVIERFAQADGSSFRAAYGFTASEKIVLCVSRMDYQKNQLGLIRAFSVFSVNHPDHRLVLLGAVTVETYYQQIQDEIERLGLRRVVRVIPGLEPDDPLLPGAYKAAEQFVLPTHHEPFGIVILEAWAAGTPVVATRVGGIPGFTADRENILWVEKGSEHALVECMSQLSDDAALRVRLSSKAYEKVCDSFSESQVTARMRDIYEQVLRD